MSDQGRGALGRAVLWAPLLAVVVAFPAQAGNGLAWLTAQQNLDGSYGGTTTSLATQMQSTSEVLRAQVALGQTSATSFASALAYVDGFGEEHTEFLARQIIADASAGNPIGSATTRLLASQNRNGGFGDRPVHDPTVLSTAFALEALAAGGQPGSQVSGAVAFLLGRQALNGSFSDGANGGSVYLTALALRALWPFRDTYSGVAAAAAAALRFLLSEVGPDALWGENFLTSIALLAAVPGVPDISVLEASVAALRAQQRPDDSWEADTYTTALAIQALAAFDSRKSGTPPPTSGSIAGHVIKAGSTEPIAGATVTLTEAPGSSVVSNGDGYYLMPALPSGRYTITATKAGYTAASAVVTTDALKATVAPNLVLDLLPQTGLVRGLVFETATRAPLKGVQVTLVGTSSYSVLSNSAGLFDFGPVVPGNYTLTFALAGYNSMSGAATVAAGQTLSAQLGMTPAGGFLDSSPGTVRGTVIDGKSRQPISGAVFDLGAGRSGTSAADGTFSISAVPRAAYQGAVRALGYQTVNFSLVFPAGASGDIGAVSLFPQAASQPPTMLTLHVLVADGVTNAPIAGAAATLVETGASAIAGANGRLDFSGLTLKNFSIALAAAGHISATYAIQVSAFGEAAVTLRLSPPGSGVTTSSLSGVVKNAGSGAAIAGAVVSIGGTSLSATTAADGRYALSGIQPLDFTLSVAAVRYQQETFTLHLTARGSFSLDAALLPVTGTSFQIVSVVADQRSYGANVTATFTARIASLLSAVKSALVLGEIQDSTGASVAKVTPYAQGTTLPVAQFAFAAGEVKNLTVPWNTGQLPPGSYRLVLRVVEPGTINRAVPLGRILAENSGYLQLTAAQAIAGGVLVDPPLTQAGLPTPISFSAVVQNGGNVPLPAGAYELKVVKPADASTLFTAVVDAPGLEVGATAQVAFGSWVPTTSGNLTVTVRRKTGDIAGALTASLYVGDKASGAFTVDRSLVPEGTQTVRGKIAMQGVDTSQGSSTDPLINLVRASVTKGGSFVAPAAVRWYQSNRCLGCHIQSQSLLGLSAAFGKGDIDRAATTQLYNGIVSSQWLDGALRISHPEFAKTQTTLDLWSLGSWPDKAGSFRAKGRAARFLQNVKIRSGDQTRWTADHYSGWWNTDQSNTSMTIKAYAGLVRDAAQIPLQSVVDYSLGPARSFGSGYAQGMTAGPDSALYLASSAGVVYRMNVSTGATTTAYSGLPVDIQGLAFAADRTLYVSTASGTLISLKPDGTRVDRSVGGYLADVAIGPDALLYFADYNGQRILRSTASSAVEVYASGGLFSYPHSLAFDAGGNLLVANQFGYNILKVAPDRSVSIYAEGLAYQPVRMALAPDGSLFVTTSQAYNNGGIVRVLANSTVERVLQQEGVLAVAAVGPALHFANNNANTIQPLIVAPLDTSGLLELRAEIAYGARFLLASYTDNNVDNTVHAQRLIGLAEARDMVSDPALAASIDTAVAYEANLLRSRQLADGGWPRYLGSASDPLVTAMVGIALEYTSPSAADPQIRKTIQYLLNTQRPDGSWDNVNNGLSTRLASTSFVMVFMPKALERLGSIDVALHVKVPSNVRLSNPTLAPTAVQSNSDQTTDYTWTLPGVTSAGREVDFDLTLAGMALHEGRPVATTAFLEFTNSFVEQKIQLPLDVPAVRAESQLALAVGTDKASYQAGERVAISSTVSNRGSVVASGQVALAIRAAGSTAHLVDLPPIAASNVAGGAQLTLPATWNTGTTLAGDYQVYGQLTDGAGRLLSDAVAPLRITAPAAVAVTSVSTDKQVYAAWDFVNLSGLARNVADNALLAPSRAELSVADPSGASIYSASADVEQLAPHGSRSLSYKLKLVDARAGTYPVTLVLKDRFTRGVLSTSTAGFQVQRQTVQGLSGAVSVASRQVFQGDPNSCTETTRNQGAAAVAGAKLIHRLVAVDTTATVEDKVEFVDLPAAGQAQPFVHSFSTQGLAVGGYACVLLAQLDTGVRTLASAAFRVLQPPVKLAASLSLGGRGRLLVLLDRRGCGDERGDRSVRGRPDDECEDDDNTRRQSEAQRAAQRAFLEKLLQDDGWSYKVSDNEIDFTREFHTGGYRVYALFSSAGRLGEAIRKQLREAVFRGEGLFVAGSRDARARALADALGLRINGRVRGATSFAPATAASPIEGPVMLLERELPLRARLRTAESLAIYRLAPGAPHDECGEEDEDHERSSQPPGRRQGSDECGGRREQGCGCGGLDAIAANTYGKGGSAFAGMDLLAIAKRDGKASAGGDDLRTLLHLVQPAAVETFPRSVVPVQLTVTNQGIAVPVSVSAPIPQGAEVVDPGPGQLSGPAVSFSFPLDVGEVKTVRYWVRLPAAAGPVLFQATVRATHGAFSFSTTPKLTLQVVAPDTLAALASDAMALAGSDGANARALRRAAAALREASRHNAMRRAIEDALEATDALLGITSAGVVQLRVRIDQWLREAGQFITP